MGLYAQNAVSNTQISDNLRRRSSLDLLGVDEFVKNGGPKIDLGRDSVIDPTDIAAILRKKEKERQKCYRFRKRLNILLHTHIALILVCVLSSLDAVCVIGQVICDILIMSEKIDNYNNLQIRATKVLADYFNDTHFDDWSFEEIIDHIESISSSSSGQISEHGHDTHTAFGVHNHETTVALITNALLKPILSRRVRSTSGDGPMPRAGGGDGHEVHSLAYEFTHSFHIGSMALLSALMLETFLKIFAMGKHFLHHKLEVFDAFVIMVSWCLDVAFWEGIWAKPGQEGATLLIFILPWRVIRIVNSFVLVIQEKDLVLLKVVKQRLRMSLRKEKDFSAKLDKYRLEVRQLQGLCRKLGADENAIQACCPAGRRRRSSLFQSLTSLASVALVSAMASSPTSDPGHVSSSDSEEEKEIPKVKPTMTRHDSMDSDKSIKFTISPEPEDVEYEIKVKGHKNQAFTFDEKDISKYKRDSKAENSHLENHHTKL